MIIYNGYQIKPHAQVPTCYVVVTDGKGGKIPAILEGLFTTPTLAKEVIDRYLETKVNKEPKDDKEVNKRGI